MARAKVSAKQRQQRSRLAREAQRQAQLEVARQAEQQQQTQEDLEEELGVATSPQHEQADREEDRAEASRGNAGKVAEREGAEGQEKVLAEQPTKSQEDNAQEDKEEDGKGDEGDEGNGGGEGEKKEDEEEEEEGEDGNDDGEHGQLLLTDYEKQRERRLKENADKLAALNLPALASSFASPAVRPRRQCSKVKSKKDDDYVPTSSSDSENSGSDNNEEDVSPSGQQDVDAGEYDEDQALQEAIALSLTPTGGKVVGTKSKVSQTRKGKRQVPAKNGGAQKRKKSRQEQFTVDDIAAIFSLIDEKGNGKFSMAELERIVRSHDFTWSKQEISDMIDIFDSNKDGQLDLAEFQDIFGRMRMLNMRIT